jgi:AAA15 family ATPase/GTPase
MRIESFHIQGFKSLADVKVEGLSDINVFYGLNDVGKSNIFQALALWYRTLVVEKSSTITMPLSSLETGYGPSLFQFGSNDLIRIEVSTRLDRIDFPNQGALADWLSVLAEIGTEIPGLSSKLGPMDKIQIVNEIEIKSSSKEVKFRIENQVHIGEQKYPFSVEHFEQVFPSAFHTIQATRRLQVEHREQENSLSQTVVSDHNLKRALFYAYLSRDLQQKRRLEAIKQILADPPFSLGELDVALDPKTDQIDIGFVRPDGRLPLENLGSGSQQLLLVLGQIFLNDYPLIAIEEPEMNLSPRYQQYLLVALRQLMQNPDVKLNQLFISTHSPYFEFEENFFDVTMDEQGVTHVAKLPIEDRNRYFPGTEIGQETGARLNSLDQVKLYDGLIQDLELQRGDLVIFTKNEAGRWEVRPEKEIIEELETVSDNN